MVGIRCCYKCPDRHVGCHSKCLKYIDEKQKLEVTKMGEKESKPVVISQGSFTGSARHRHSKAHKRTR